MTLSNITVLSGVIQLYLEGFHESDPTKLAAAFHPTAQLLVVRGGELQSSSIGDYLAMVGKRAPVNEPDRKKEFHSLSFAGETVAVARLTVGNGKAQFEDALTLVREASGWKIAVKVYHAVDLQSFGANV